MRDATNERAQYELFQRLNTGGSQLSDQEVRNAILVMLNPGLYRWIEELAKRSSFVECVALSDRSTDLRYDMELILRFLTLRRASDGDLRDVGDLGSFLTREMRKMADNPESWRSGEERAFDDTFNLLKDCLWGRCLSQMG